MKNKFATNNVFMLLLSEYNFLVAVLSMFLSAFASPASIFFYLLLLSLFLVFSLLVCLFICLRSLLL